MSTTRFRERRQPFKSTNIKVGKLQKFVNSFPSGPNSDVMVTPAISADIERCWDQQNPGPPYRTGGPFTDVKIKLPFHGVKGKGTYTTNPVNITAGISWKYVGGFTNPQFIGDPVTVNTYVGQGLTPLSSTMLPNLTGYGTKAYKLLKPNPTQSGAAVFLAELRDLPRMLRTTSRSFADSWKFISTGSRGSDRGKKYMSPKWASDQFLNHQFGWSPFLRDVAKMWDVGTQLQHFIDSVRTLNNQWIRRRRVIDHQETSVRLNTGFNLAVEPLGITIEQMLSPMVVDGTPCSAYWNLHSRETLDVWAEGSFKFYRPEFDPLLAEFDSVTSQVRRLMTLYGLKINPSVLWQITPWSWLVDWFTSIGDSIDNISAMLDDAVVARYLYIMGHKRRYIEMTQVLNFWHPGPVALTWVREFESKQRVPSITPYGFDLSWGNLSPRQITILGALGISRV